MIILILSDAANNQYCQSTQLNEYIDKVSHYKKLNDITIGIQAKKIRVRIEQKRFYINSLYIRVYSELIFVFHLSPDCCMGIISLNVLTAKTRLKKKTQYFAQDNSHSAILFVFFYSIFSRWFGMVVRLLHL